MAPTTAIPHTPQNQTKAARRPPRRENRRQAVLKASAALFKSKGFERTSVRDIAAASGMLPGSIYFHFRAKEEILLAVQKAGIQHLSDAVESAILDVQEPWAKLEAACIAHMRVILGESDFAAAVLDISAARNSSVWPQIAAMRDEYEKNFRQLVDDLPVPPGTNRKYLRLALLGSINWTHRWYRPGRDSPAQLAVEIVWLFRCGLDPE